MGGIIRNWKLPYFIENKEDFLTDQRQSLSYNDFMKQATAVAVKLEKKNIRGKAVCVCAERSVDTLINFMGVLLSGNYYVPLSKEMPDEKVDTIKEQVNMAAFLEGMDEPEEGGDIPEVSEADYKRLYEALEDVADESPLYVVFTSGSTGVPKGIVKSHKSMMSFIHAYVDEFHWQPEERLGNQTPFYFDASAKDFYLSLYVKCSMVVLDTTLFSRPRLLLDTLNEQRITAIQWVPSALTMVSMLGTFRQVIPKYLRRVYFVGEAFAAEQLRRWMEALPETEFVNLYGASEMAGICAFCRMDPLEFAETGEIPIGYPLSNSRIFLMGADGSIIGQEQSGQKGEICLSGEALADGYLQDAERTKERFVHREGKVYYRTGDQARYDTAGRLVFAGREDFQIKHMGHRIELEEIEKAAQEVAGVVDACCVYNKNKIVLFYTGVLEKAPFTAALKEKLPPYMMPNRLENLTDIPKNAHGKKDRIALETKLKKERGRRNGRDKRNHT